MLNFTEHLLCLKYQHPGLANEACFQPPVAVLLPNRHSGTNSQHLECLREHEHGFFPTYNCGDQRWSCKKFLDNSVSVVKRFHETLFLLSYLKGNIRKYTPPELNIKIRSITFPLALMKLRASWQHAALLCAGTAFHDRHYPAAHSFSLLLLFYEQLLRSIDLEEREYDFGSDIRSLIQPQEFVKTKINLMGSSRVVD